MYLRRDKVIAIIDEISKGIKRADPYEAGRQDALDGVCERITDMDIEDVVPIAVRCKDCAYAWHSSEGLRCEKWGTFDEDCCCSPNEFCSRGKHK